MTCHTSCKTCVGPSQYECASCDSSKAYYRPSSWECVSCTAGTYASDAQQACLLCDPSCLTCIGPGSDQCDSCDSKKAYFVSNLRQCVSCAVRTYGNDATK